MLFFAVWRRFYPVCGRKPNPTPFERRKGALQRILRVKQSLEPYPYRPPFRTCSRTFGFFHYNFEFAVLLHSDFPNIQGDDCPQTVCIVRLIQQIGQRFHFFDEFHSRLVIFIIGANFKTFWLFLLKSFFFSVKPILTHRL